MDRAGGGWGQQKRAEGAPFFIPRLQGPVVVPRIDHVGLGFDMQARDACATRHRLTGRFGSEEERAPPDPAATTAAYRNHPRKLREAPGPWEGFCFFDGTLMMESCELGDPGPRSGRVGSGSGRAGQLLFEKPGLLRSGARPGWKMAITS